MKRRNLSILASAIGIFYFNVNGTTCLKTSMELRDCQIFSLSPNSQYSRIESDSSYSPRKTLNQPNRIEPMSYEPRQNNFES